MMNEWIKRKDAVFFSLFILVSSCITYCSAMDLIRTAAKAGCQSSSVFDASYQAYVYCNRKADAISWGWKGDFEANGKLYTFDKDAEIYVLKGEVK